MAGLERALLALLLLVTGCGASGRTDATAARPSPTAAVVVEAAPVPEAAVTEDVGRRQVARFRLPGGPDYLAASGGLLWVKHDDGKLVGIAPDSNQVRRTVRVARNPGAPGGACQGLGGDAAHLWTCAGPGVALVAAAATTVEPLPGVEKISDQTRLPVVDGRVWVLAPDGQEIIGLRVTDGMLSKRLPLPVRCTDGAAGAAPFLWLVCPTAGAGLRLDVRSGEHLEIAGLRDVRTVAVAGPVFFGYRGGVARVDPATVQVTAAAAHIGAAGLHADRSALWVRGGTAFLRKVDPTSLELLEQLSAPETSDGSVLVAYGSLWTTAYDDAVLYRLHP